MTWQFLYRIKTKFFEKCNPVLLTTLRETMKSLDDKWNRTHEALYEILSAAQKSITNDPNVGGIGEIADDLNELKASEVRKLSSMSQEVSKMIKNQQKLNTNCKSFNAKKTPKTQGLFYNPDLAYSPFKYTQLIQRELPKQLVLSG